MPTKERLRKSLQSQLDEAIRLVNRALKGKDLATLAPVLKRLGKGQQLPPWYERLRREGAMPSDGKSIGSVIEMLFVAVLETNIFAAMKLPPFGLSPARGVDLPDLDLGIKSPSTNFCTSEPYFSAYERLLGSGHDILVLLTDYQTAKKEEPLRLQITQRRYLRASQVADKKLCGIALKHRDRLVEDEDGVAQRFFRFLAYVNQSDWRAKRLLEMCNDLNSEDRIRDHVVKARKDFERYNKNRLKSNGVPLPDSEIESIEKVSKISPQYCGVLHAADNWLADVRNNAALPPSPGEWAALLRSKFEGVIGMSLALQWRYNLGPLFGKKAKCSDDPLVG
jgi:hypothetical protein